MMDKVIKMEVTRNIILCSLCEEYVRNRNFVDAFGCAKDGDVVAVNLVGAFVGDADSSGVAGHLIGSTINWGCVKCSLYPYT